MSEATTEDAMSTTPRPITARRNVYGADGQALFAQAEQAARSLAGATGSVSSITLEAVNASGSGWAATAVLSVTIPLEVPDPPTE